MEQQWSIYILRCADQSFYTGIALDPQRRLDEHNHDNQKAAKYTRARRPVSLVYCEPAADRSSASKREYVIKKLSRSAKLALIDSSQQYD
ncbi:MAG: GIY-YIG nuclease family protein [Gammaproteobacteria bacterium]|nr:GIY-YIG nuclease family protein [Gammaproteobacteria bacterium]